MVIFCFLFVVVLTQVSAFLFPIKLPAQTTPTKLKFTNCLSAAERTTQYASIDHISLVPDPVMLPGNLTVGGHIQINKDITSHGLKMNVEIDKILLGIKTKMPCVSKVGSCSYDFCDLIGYSDGNSTHDCDRSELAGLHLPCKCPITAGSYTLPPHLFSVPKIDGVWSWLASGAYHVHVELIDTNARNLKAGCFDIDLSLTNTKPSGFFFN